MAKDLIRFSNDKKGFLMLLAIEALLVLGILAVMIHLLRAGDTRRVCYSAISLFAVCYIFCRSLRNYRMITKAEKIDAKKKEEKSE